VTSTALRQRFLVLHDYGMGGLWWWITADSARQIAETFAEVEVIEDADSLERAATWGLDEVDVDAPTWPVGLDELKNRRDGQRGRPGFAAFADREIGHFRQTEDGIPTVYLIEVGSDGRRFRQVELHEDGSVWKSGPEDWPFNPPVVDMFDPDLVDCEIDAAEFEAQWNLARQVERV